MAALALPTSPLSQQRLRRTERKGNHMRVAENSMTPIEALYQRARTSPNGVAFIVGDEKCKYAWLAAQAERLARGLAGRGIQKADRIALHMLNRPEFVVAVYACFHIAAVAVPLSNRLKTIELRPLLEQLRPALYIGDTNRYSLVDEIDRSILPREKRFVAGDMRENEGAQPWASLFNDGSAPLPVTADMHSPAVLLPTLGTTGVFKFVIHTQATLAALFGLPFMCGGQ
jgi:acyl-CoA synthetase (AMP-forming)/AMP-acid ligase II